MEGLGREAAQQRAWHCAGCRLAIIRHCLGSWSWLWSWSWSWDLRQLGFLLVSLMVSDRPLAPLFTMPGGGVRWVGGTEGASRYHTLPRSSSTCGFTLCINQLVCKSAKEVEYGLCGPGSMKENQYNPRSQQGKGAPAGVVGYSILYSYRPLNPDSTSPLSWDH